MSLSDVDYTVNFARETLRGGSYWDAVGTCSSHTPVPDLDWYIPYGTVCTTWYVAPPLSNVSLSDVDYTVNFARETLQEGVKRRTGMSAKKSSLDKARGAVRRAIVAAVVMAASAMRAMVNSVRTTRAMLTRQL